MNKNITISLDEKLVEQIKELSVQECRSLSAQVSLILKKYLETKLK